MVNQVVIFLSVCFKRTLTDSSALARFNLVATARLKIMQRFSGNSYRLDDQLSSFHDLHSKLSKQ